MRPQAAPTDTDLVKRVLAGDPAPYQLLVERHYTAVFNAAYRVLGSRAEADDMTQDTFLRAYKALDTFRAGAPMAPWLCRIAINLSLNQLKRRKRTVSLDQAAGGAALELPDLSGEPQRHLLRDERQQQLRGAILALLPQQRAIIELRHFQELSYDEIAQALGISVANVKVRLFRARKRLRDLLQEDD